MIFANYSFLPTIIHTQSGLILQLSHLNKLQVGTAHVLLARHPRLSQNGHPLQKKVDFELYEYTLIFFLFFSD
jgi:hypothetical protein